MSCVRHNSAQKCNAAALIKIDATRHVRVRRTQLRIMNVCTHPPSSRPSFFVLQIGQGVRNISQTTLVHIYMMTSHSCNRFVGRAFLMQIFHLAASQRRSAGLRSGKYEGNWGPVNSFTFSNKRLRQRQNSLVNSPRLSIDYTF